MSERAILHIDMNNFYASVECMLNPDLKKYPIAVCGSQEERHGIVLAKNYKAKAFGVSTGEAIWQAKQKCPDLVTVPPHYEQYMRFSKLAREIYGRYTDLVEPFGMDEVWADVTGCQHFIGSPLHIAEEIKETVKYELGLTVSIAAWKWEVCDGIFLQPIEQHRKELARTLSHWNSHQAHQYGR